MPAWGFLLLLQLCPREYLNSVPWTPRVRQTGGEGRAETREKGRKGTELSLSEDPRLGTMILNFSQTVLNTQLRDKKHSIWSTDFPKSSEKRHRIPQDLLALWKIQFPAKWLLWKNRCGCRWTADLTESFLWVAPGSPYHASISSPLPTAAAICQPHSPPRICGRPPLQCAWPL